VKLVQRPLRHPANFAIGTPTAKQISAAALRPDARTFAAERWLGSSIVQWSDRRRHVTAMHRDDDDTGQQLNARYRVRPSSGGMERKPASG
jgi:hypothetical protein